MSFATLEKQGYTGYLLKDAPEKIVQFGEGNFLRAFADIFVDLMNEKADFNAKVVLVQPRGGHPEAADRFGEQDGLYTLILRGRENGEPVENTRIISAASRCLDPKRDWEKLLDCARNPELRFVISNTTEAGIAFDPACKAEDTPPSAFPAKLTLFLHERWKKGFKGIIILSCELIDHNGQEDLPLQPTGEEGILLIRALCGLDRLVSNVNIPNSALQIPNLPAHTVVETNALFEKDAVRPVFAGAMPEQVRELVLPHVENQDRTLKAALNCDRELVYEAFLADPLVKGRAAEPEIRRLVDDMIANTARFLPAGWK